jgi:hypothetical protein
VGRRKNPLSDDREAIGLFEEYKRIPHSVTIGNSKKKPTANLTISEAKLYLNEHSRNAGETLTEMQRLVHDLEQYKNSENDSLGILMQRRIQSSGDIA